MKCVVLEKVKFIFQETLRKKLSFLLKTSSVNMTKSAVSCDLVTITEEILNGKGAVKVVSTNPKVYLRPCQTSIIKLLVVNLFREKSQS